MLRVMLVDDERLARQAIRQLLATMPEIEVVAEADSVAAARAALGENEIDGMFLDVQMPRETGFALFRDGAPAAKVIFVTAHAEHAVKAFDVDAVDYLLKPVRLTRLQTAIERLRVACDGRPDDQRYHLGDRICLRIPGRTVVAALDRVVALEADGDFTRISVSDESPLMICQPLRTYEEMLPKPPFVRVDRSVIINLDGIVRTERLSRDVEKVWLSGRPNPVVLGRTAQARLREALLGSGRAVT